MTHMTQEQHSRSAKPDQWAWLDGYLSVLRKRLNGLNLKADFSLERFDGGTFVYDLTITNKNGEKSDFKLWHDTYDFCDPCVRFPKCKSSEEFGSMTQAFEAIEAYCKAWYN